jgi:hypothetical protein
MEFQLDDKTSFNPRFVAMISELWDSGGKIMLKFNDNCKTKYTVFQSKDPLLDIRYTSKLGIDYYEIYTTFLGIQTCTAHGSSYDINKSINDNIRKIYKKYSTNGLEYPIYQMLECYLVGIFIQTKLSWGNILIDINDNKFTLTYDDEIFIDVFECTPKDYAIRLMESMRNGIAPEIFYAGLPIKRMKSARNNFLIPLIPRNE